MAQATDIVNEQTPTSPGAKSSQLSIYDITVAEFIPVFETQSDPKLIASFFDELSLSGLDSHVTSIEYRKARIIRLKIIYEFYTRYGVGEDILQEEGFDIETFAVRMASEEANLQIQLKEYEGSAKGEPIGKKWFYKSLNAISDYKKREIGDNILLGQFCEHYKNLASSVKTTKKDHGE